MLQLNPIDMDLLSLFRAHRLDELVQRPPGDLANHLGDAELRDSFAGHGAAQERHAAVASVRPIIVANVSRVQVRLRYQYVPLGRTRREELLCRGENLGASLELALRRLRNLREAAEGQR
jgi:hypothetical protein